MNKYERCVLKVKERSPQVNPWAVCTKSVGRPPRRGRPPIVRTGPRGGRYILKNERKVYLKKE